MAGVVAACDVFGFECGAWQLYTPPSQQLLTLLSCPQPGHCGVQSEHIRSHCGRERVLLQDGSLVFARWFSGLAQEQNSWS